MEIIGTNGSRPGEGEWYLDKAGARELVKGDWEDWGDLRIRFDSVRVRERENAGWMSIPATVTKHVGEEDYRSYLDRVKDCIDAPDIPAKWKLHDILRGGTNTVFELERGERFVWPVRITAVAARDGGMWKFAQMCFSFPTVYFPDVREFGERA